MDFPPLHEDLSFNAPLSAARAADLVAFVTAAEPATILDVGCGWAELLLRSLVSTSAVKPAAVPASVGIGIDVDGAALAHGRAQAEARGLADRVTLVQGEGAANLPQSADAAICVGARHVWGSNDAALAALHALLPRGGRLVYGEGIWSRPPTPAACEPLGGSPAEYASLADLVDVAVAQGFRPLGVGEATQEEWDGFESGYSAGYERWLLDNPAAHPDADRVRQMADEHRSGYLRGYRGVLGFAYLCLVAD